MNQLLDIRRACCRQLPATLFALICACVCAGAMVAGPALAAHVDPFDVQVVQTNQALTQRLQPLPDIRFTGPPARSEPVISVNAGVRYQGIRGFGAAMTDTSAWLIERELSPAARGALIGSLFGAQGIHLDFLRVPMGASDFTHTGRPYAYDDLPPGRADPELRHFSIGHDRPYILPALRQLRAADPGTQFLATPWTAPAWMKTNGALSNIGNSGLLRRAADHPWAAYFVKFLQAYAAAGVPISALTVQNEPGTPTLYPGMNFTAPAESAWTSRYLEPALARARLHPRLYAGGLGWGPNSGPFINASITGRLGARMSGISWHCYYGQPGVMAQFHQATPRLDEIVSECSPGGISPTPTAELAISSVREWASTVALWNLALDPRGGPVQAPNHGCPGCVGLATIDERMHATWFTRSYYQLGQLSAFVAPGAQRIASNTFVSYAYPRRGVNVATPGLDDVAFRNPDGSIVLVAYDNAPRPATFAVSWRGTAFSYTLPPEGIATLLWNRTG